MTDFCPVCNSRLDRKTVEVDMGRPGDIMRIHAKEIDKLKADLASIQRQINEIMDWIRSFQTPNYKIEESSAWDSVQISGSL